MPRAVLILLLSWACVGCAVRGTLPGPAPTAGRGGLVRILPADEREAEALRGALTGPFLHVDGVRFVQADGTDPGLMLRLGEADLAVLYGRAAGGLIDSGERRLRLSRAPGWDRTYFLWSEPRHRWLNDPALRRWLAGILEREPMLRFLFDGRGSAAYSLSSPDPVAPIWAEPGPAPFARHARPRLSLRFDRQDPHAASIAARVKAVLDAHGVELALLPRLAEELIDGLRSKEAELTLLVHQATSEDAVEALDRTLRRLDPAEAEGATPAQVERSLLEQARLVPLVRLEAWLARSHRLEGVRAGTYPVLRLETARWRR